MPEKSENFALPRTLIPRLRGGSESEHTRSQNTHDAESAESGKLAKLAIAGTLTGLVTGLLGGGTGTVLVPLLVLWLAFDQRQATGTSLVAVALMTAAGAAMQGAQGNVDVLKALEIGLPAIGGVVLGSWLHQRIHADILGLLFGLVLVAAAINMVIK